MDITGEHQREAFNTVRKKRLSETGVEIPREDKFFRKKMDKLTERRANGYCGSCYGGRVPQTGCCNLCEEVWQAYANKGWRFGNPDGVEQVELNAEFLYNELLIGFRDSALRKIGQSTSRTRQMRGAIYLESSR